MGLTVSHPLVTSTGLILVVVLVLHGVDSMVIDAVARHYCYHDRTDVVVVLIVVTFLFFGHTSLPQHF